jgi:energy-coupling factor transporter ATP-binding protein EcfA2
MINQVTIDGFRGIDGLCLDDLGRINVFVGPNGGGKTAILEAMGIVSQAPSLGILGKINAWRGMLPLNADQWHSLLTIFGDLNPHKDIVFRITTHEGDASVTLRAIFGDANASQTPPDTEQTDVYPATSLTFEERLRGIESVYRSSQGGEVKARLDLIPGDFHLNVERKGLATGKQKPRSPIPGSFFIHARRSTSLAETASALTALYARRAEGDFVDAVKRVDPRIKRLVPGMQGKQPTVLADIGLKTLIPITALGDGFCRVSLIATGMVSGEPGKLLIVDEIDSGLYYTVMGGLWESLVKLSQEHDFQVFCSTHNEEMLRQTVPAFSRHPQALKIFRISRDQENRVCAKMYDYEMLQDAEHLGMDIR